MRWVENHREGDLVLGDGKIRCSASPASRSPCEILLKTEKVTLVP